MIKKLYSDDSDVGGKEGNFFNSVKGVKQMNMRERQLFSGMKVLKFRNQEAYIYGETQMIYFSDIREHIKSN